MNGQGGGFDIGEVKGAARLRRLARAALILLALALAGLALGGCHLRPLLSDVSMAPDQISPNGDGVQDATNISYTLSRSAKVSVFFVDAAGQKYYFRQDRPRAPGTYQVLWSGVINEPRSLSMAEDYGREKVQSWVLPDGAYTWVVEATDENGAAQQVTGQIRISGGDSTVPELRKFSVSLPVFTPNQDGLEDRTGISYYLNKNVDNVLVYLYDPATPEIHYPLAEQPRAIKPGEAGYHYYDYDGGVDQGSDPPADGTYVVVGEASDLAGNRVVVSSTLTIEQGGVPRAYVLGGTIDWGGEVDSKEGPQAWMPLGATLVFTTYIENYGKVPIRTAGPFPGTGYRTDENYNTLAVATGNPSFHEQAGVWRFGIRFDTSITDFPYRWAVGRPDELRREVIDGQEQWFLDPGKRGTVTGSIELVGPFPREAIYAWGALIHEYVGVSAENNYVDRILLHIGQP